MPETITHMNGFITHFDFFCWNDYSIFCNRFCFVGAFISIYWLNEYKKKNYTGDGNATTFAISTYSGGIQHTENSVIVFLNGVAQIPGTNYTVNATGSLVVFSAGDAPLSTDVVHILELPI